MLHCTSFLEFWELEPIKICGATGPTPGFRRGKYRPGSRGDPSLVNHDTEAIDYKTKKEDPATLYLV